MPLRRALILLAALLAAPVPVLAQPGDPSFNLVNRSGNVIAVVNVVPAGAAGWGPDLLGNDVLPDGRSLPVRIPPAAGCRHDIRVIYAGGRLEERRNLDTCAVAEVVFGEAAIPRGAGGNPSFNLVNHGMVPIREVYVSSVRETTWGRPRLPRPLDPGEHLAVRLPVDDCVNDVRVVWMDGRLEDRRRVDTCRLVNMVFR